MAKTMQLPCVLLGGAPTTATVGWAGLLGMDETSANGDLYKCIRVSGGTYTWRKIGEGGGTGVPGEITADGIVTALGYTPASQADLALIGQSLNYQQQLIDQKQPLGDYALKDDVKQLSSAKVNLPTNEDGTPNYGTAGYYAVSDGAGGITWVASGNTGGGETTTHGIVWDLVNVTSSNPITSVSDGASIIAVLTANDGYTLGDVNITMGGEVVTGAWNADTATVTIANVTGDVIISCAGVEQTGPVDTSPVIRQTGVGFRAVSTSSNETVEESTIIVSNEGCCITKIYQFEPDIDGIKASTIYDAENDYLTVSKVVDTIACYTPSLKTRAEGLKVMTNETKVVRYLDGAIVSHTTNTSITATESPAEIVAGKGRYHTNEMYANGVAFTLAIADVDDSYAYWTSQGTYTKFLPVGVRNGDIIFAGKNTPYYGMANIDGTMAGGGSATTVELSVDDDYAMDYGVSAANLVTDNAGTNLAGNLDTAYAEAIEEAKNAWLSECNGNIDKIPLIIHTDQHTNFNKDLFDFISNIVDWYDIGKVVNLGDTVNSYGDASNVLSNAYLENYIESMASVPYSKRIEVYGNHDTYGDVENTGMIPQNHLYKYFRNIYARRMDNYGNFVTFDDNYNIKYVVVSGFAYDFSIGGYSHYIIPQDSIYKIIAELEKSDGYDVIILSHVPLGTTTTTVYNSLDGTTEEKSVGGVNFKLLTDLWTGRKAKTAGSVTDEYGTSYEFDFTACDGELLCGLHGHMHADGYYYIGELLDVYFDAYYISPKAIHFVIVDRENRRLNVWKVDNSPAYQNYQIPFDKPTT